MCLQCWRFISLCIFTCLWSKRNNTRYCNVLYKIITFLLAHSIHFIGSHDINSMRDMRDALGALGPVNGKYTYSSLYWD